MQQINSNSVARMSMLLEHSRARKGQKQARKKHARNAIATQATQRHHENPVASSVLTHSTRASYHAAVSHSGQEAASTAAAQQRAAKAEQTHSTESTHVSRGHGKQGRDGAGIAWPASAGTHDSLTDSFRTTAMAIFSRVQGALLRAAHGSDKTVAKQSFYELADKLIDGTPVTMSAYKGQVLLVVNVASK